MLRRLKNWFLQKIQEMPFRVFRWRVKLLDLFHLPIRTRYGFRFIPTFDENSILALFHRDHRLEEYDLRFVARFLRQGDIFIDIGAHHGLYSLLADICVKPYGKVISFEPSPRERSRLLNNIAANKLEKIVHVEAYALTDKKGEATLFVSSSYESGLNSLKPPNSQFNIESTITIQTYTLDDYVKEHSINTIRLIKMDAEGAELSILRRSIDVLTRIRPVWLIEVESFRTLPWGYAAEEILRFLEAYGYRWYVAQKEGLQPFHYTPETRLNRNYIAIPQEQAETILAYLQQRPFRGFPKG
ncbi:MAG: FkbM family methyltransferase [Bacteroidia bacterium]|nr:FkbM family methyltransferase [Bacteroidia bacterium]MDW8089571.1 FkbM family methyltransferase [Bacteroidia bacterium]